MKTIVIPRMGKVTDAYKELFNRLNINCIYPPLITKKTIELGNERIDELMCFPAKITMGNFREALEEGYKTLVMWDSCGPCRFKCYWSLQKHVLTKLGYKDFEMIPITSGNLIKQIYYLSEGKTNIYKIANSMMKTWKELKELEKDNLKENDINIGIIGEIYTVNCPEVNMDLFKKLENLSAGYKNYVTNLQFIKENLLLFKLFKNKSKFEELASNYMPHKENIGGHGFQSIVHLLEAIDEKLDGVIHILPFPCSPESVVSPILDIIAEENNFPLIHLIFDEHTGEAGIETRLEAFVDMIKLKNSGIINLRKVKEGKPTKKGYIGLDVGSVSTKAVLLNEEGDISSKIYTETKGDPIEATKECLKHILKDNTEIIGFGVTGSSRKLIGKVFKADLIKNEITSQTIGCLSQYDNINSIIEIGGQDSKIILLKDKIPIYYNMNSICSAGTGSFLSHQQKRMGFDTIEEFAECSLKSSCQVRIAGRCGVFAESDLIHKQALNKKEDLIAGLNRALVINYIKNVARNRRLEEPIFFSGGVASNKGVIKAFNEYLNTEVIVSNFNKINGAIGIALLTKERISESNFRRDIIDSEIERKTNFCNGCGNQCEITFIYKDNEKIDCIGNRCEKGNKNV